MLIPQASALGQLASRSLVISSGVPDATGVTYTFTFTPETSSVVQGLKFVACTSAIGTYPSGTCTAPTGMTASGDGFDNAVFGTKSNWAASSADFAVDGTGANDCTPAPNVLCANRTDGSTEATASHTISFTSVKNPSVSAGSPAGTAFYVGIYTYSTSNYTLASRVDFGATASAVVQTLTTAAAVAEVLNFCVGATTVDDTSSPIADDCSHLGGTSINIGTLDSATVNVSPVPNDGGDNQNGVAMVRSNAGNGTVIAYDAVQQSGTSHKGTLRITGSSCDGSAAPSGGLDPGDNTNTDACINAAGDTQAVFTPGQEKFGMTIAGINSSSTTSYTCAYGGPGNTCDLEPLSGYLGKGTTGSEVYCNTCNSADGGNGFAWDETGTAVNIASSAGSTVKQIDDEALILKFAATPSITTPFGRYQAQTDMIAMPTY